MTGAYRVDELAGRSMRWSAAAGDTVPVVLLGGVGVGSWAWAPVTELLDGVRTVLVDRPGMGTTWPDRLPTLAEEVASLADLLGRLDGPAVVVAHSMAAFHGEALVRRHPDLVSGLVLVDGSTETDPPAPDPRRERRALVLARATRRVLRLPGPHALPPVVMQVGQAVQSNRRRVADRLPPQGVADYRSPDAAPMVIAESRAYDRQVVDLHALRAETTWPSIPVRVLTAAADGGEQWVRDQATFAAVLHGLQQVLPDSRHFVMDDRPDAVAAAVRSLLQS